SQIRHAELAPELDVEARAGANVQHAGRFEPDSAANCAEEHPATDSVKPAIEGLTQAEPAHPPEGERLLEPVGPILLGIEAPSTFRLFCGHERATLPTPQLLARYRGSATA